MNINQLPGYQQPLKLPIASHSFCLAVVERFCMTQKGQKGQLQLCCTEGGEKDGRHGWRDGSVIKCPLFLQRTRVDFPTSTETHNCQQLQLHGLVVPVCPCLCMNAQTCTSIHMCGTHSHPHKCK